MWLPVLFFVLFFPLVYIMFLSNSYTPWTPESFRVLGQDLPTNGVYSWGPAENLGHHCCLQYVYFILSHSQVPISELGQNFPLKVLVEPQIHLFYGFSSLIPYWLFQQWYCLTASSFQTQPSASYTCMLLPDCTFHFGELLHRARHEPNAFPSSPPTRSLNPRLCHSGLVSHFWCRQLFPAHSHGVRLPHGHLKPAFIITHGQKCMNTAGDGSWSIEWKWYNHMGDLEPDFSIRIKALKWQSPFFYIRHCTVTEDITFFWTKDLNGTWSESLLHENYLL